MNDYGLDNWGSTPSKGRNTSLPLADDPQMIGATVQNLVSRAICHAGFVHPDLILCIIKIKNVWIHIYTFPAPIAWY